MPTKQQFVSITLSIILFASFTPGTAKENSTLWSNDFENGAIYYMDHGISSVVNYTLYTESEINKTLHGMTDYYSQGIQTEFNITNQTSYSGNNALMMNVNNTKETTLSVIESNDFATNFAPQGSTINYSLSIRVKQNDYFNTSHMPIYFSVRLTNPNNSTSMDGPDHYSIYFTDFHPFPLTIAGSWLYFNASGQMVIKDWQYEIPNNSDFGPYGTLLSWSVGFLTPVNKSATFIMDDFVFSTQIVKQPSGNNLEIIILTIIIAIPVLIVVRKIAQKS